MICGAIMGLTIMLIIFVSLGADTGSAVIGGTLLNMAVFGAMCSYIAQAVSFVLLRRHHAHIDRPYRSPFGNPGAWITVSIALVTISYQLTDQTYRAGVVGVVAWIAVGILYFALVGRHRLVLSPEEEFAMQQRDETGQAK
jgi:ethanolamine permease